MADLERRYPSPKGPTEARTEADSPEADHALEHRLGKLPGEVGALLIVVGVAGLLLPGPVGSPLVVAGGLVLWPEGFGRVEAWFSRKFPKAHREGVTQVDRFLGDLERRYPGATGTHHRGLP